MSSQAPAGASAPDPARIATKLGARPIVLVGMPGAGKSKVGRRLASLLGLGFVDADTEIERAADKTIPEIFAEHGEPYFRDGERRVIARLLGGGARVIATGGGAYVNEETRTAIAEAGISVWLRAERETLVERLKRRASRPLLAGPDWEETLTRLLAEREPTYAEAAITVTTGASPHDVVAQAIIDALEAHLAGEPNQ